ncbi:MAG: glycosyltransferase family 1 protein [Rubrivivax sp.]
MNTFAFAAAAAPRRPLRVAFVTETYPPEVNGVATTTAQFVDGLRRRGHAVQVVRPRQAADGEPSITRDVLMRGLPIPNYPQLRMGMPARRELERLWSLQPPQVVHVATEGPLGWSALRAAQALGLPVTSDFRTNFHQYSRHYRLGWLHRPIMGLLRRFHNAAACTMVPTEAVQRELQAAGFERVVVVPRGVDVHHYSPVWRSRTLRATWGASEGDLVLGCVGRLAPEKNLMLLLEAYRALRASQPRARLVLVGDGPMRAALEAACPDAVFAGVRRGDDLAAHYASMDLFAFPSQTETFGNVTTEALASGLPLVAFDHAAAGQLVRPGVNGLLVPCDDAAGFVATVLRLAGDELLRRRIAPQARATALALGWDGVVARFEAQLLRACGEADIAPPPARHATVKVAA